MRRNSKLRDGLAAQLRETAEEHHTAFKATDGVDPDWSIWYAERLIQRGFGDMLSAKFLKSDLVYLLVTADKELQGRAPGARWDTYYADFFLERYGELAR